MVWKEIVKKTVDGKEKSELVRTIFSSLLASGLVILVFYLIQKEQMIHLMQKSGVYLFFAVASYAMILPSIREVRAYKEFPCMSGMMIGMTVGMVAGFLSGFYVGATNGMFWGSMFGMAIGIFFGTECGRCCGIMGFMEGIMAGMMGALMGAMTAVMMVNDNSKAAGIIFFVICSIILLGLNVLIANETKGAQRKKNETMQFTMMCSAIVTIMTIFMMIYGPRSVLFQ